MSCSFLLSSLLGSRHATNVAYRRGHCQRQRNQFFGPILSENFVAAASSLGAFLKHAEVQVLQLCHD